jgi:hypothetical protein
MDVTGFLLQPFLRLPPSQIAVFPLIGDAALVYASGMFIGHYAVGFAAKRLASKTSLGTLFLSVQLVDLLWPLFLLLGLEHVRIDPGNTVVTPLDFYNYPITHSLLGAVGWSIVLGLIYFAARRNSRGAWIVGACVLSHWALDALSHRPDLLLVPGGSTRVGLGLWNSLWGTVLVEGGIFAAGVILYGRLTDARDRVGRYAFWSLVVLLAAIYALNLAGPPPPGAFEIALVGLAGWLFVPWAYWIDRHRRPTTNPGPM